MNKLLILCVAGLFAGCNADFGLFGGAQSHTGGRDYFRASAPVQDYSPLVARFAFPQHGGYHHQPAVQAYNVQPVQIQGPKLDLHTGPIFQKPATFHVSPGVIKGPHITTQYHQPSYQPSSYQPKPASYESEPSYGSSHSVSHYKPKTSEKTYGYANRGYGTWKADDYGRSKQGYGYESKGYGFEQEPKPADDKNAGEKTYGYLSKGHGFEKSDYDHNKKGYGYTQKGFGQEWKQGEKMEMPE